MRNSILVLLTSLLLVFFGPSFAQQSSNQKMTPLDVDKIVERFIQSKQPAVTEMVAESKKDLIKVMIANINSLCGNFDADSQILSSAKCTIIDPRTHDRVTISMNCQNGYCKFTKAIHEPIRITMSPTPTAIQASPNLPPESAVSTEKWLKVFAGLIYVLLTIYLFMAASTNLLKREILFLVVDLSLWAALTTAMYVVLKGGF